MFTMTPKIVPAFALCLIGAGVGLASTRQP
jgi:hypothetical protein